MPRGLTEGQGSREGEEETDTGIGGHFLSTICKTLKNLPFPEQPRRVVAFEGELSAPLSRHQLLRDPSLAPRSPDTDTDSHPSVPAPLETKT